jgi:hypothetical protein
MLEIIYPVVNKRVTARGRRPVDYRFQLYFLLRYKLFGRKKLANSFLEFNQNEKLRTILKIPLETLSLSVVDRFVLRIGEDGFKEILAVLVKECVKKGIMTGKHIVIDEFPIHSFLNIVKCLKLPNGQMNSL